MTNLITLTIPNDDHVALRAFGKALEEMALAHGAEPSKTTIGEMNFKVNIDTTDATAALERLNNATGELMQAAPRMMQDLRCEGDELQGKRKEPEVDTTAQQVESLATNVVQREVNLPEPTVSDATTDNSGTPWDERIHSASKALNADGTWRLRRKPKDMDEAEWLQLVADVKLELSGEEQYDQEELVRQEQELSQRYDIPELPVTLEEAVNASIEASHAGIAEEFGAGIANAAFTGDGVTPPGDDFHTDTGVVTEQTVAGIPPIPVPPPVVVPPAYVANDWDFPKLMKFLTERHGRITVEQVNALLAVDGLAALTDLNTHPDKIGPFVARVKAHLGE